MGIWTLPIIGIEFLGHGYALYETLSLLEKKDNPNPKETKRWLVYWITIVILYTFIVPITGLLPAPISLIASLFRAVLIVALIVPPLMANQVILTVLIENEKLLTFLRGILRDGVNEVSKHIRGFLESNNKQTTTKK